MTPGPATSPLEPLAADRFDLPDGVTYLDGNSLGALPRAAYDALAVTVRDEWGRGLISSWNSTAWNDAGWIDRSRAVAARIAPFLGADADQVHVGDSTSVSLFKTMVAAARLRPSRRVLVVEPSTFPTDGYIASGVADLLGLELRWCDPADPLAAVDDDVALLSLTHVDFRTGAMFDLASITAGAHERGALVQWDLCHSTGVVPLDLPAADADLAVGCTYKYLNGGPGSPAFTWVSPRLLPELTQPITGWMGHARPFAMARDYEPAAGIGHWASGTPPILALSTLAAALTAYDDLAVADIRSASVALTTEFIDRLDALGLDVVTPRDPARRGSQVSFRHPEAYGIVQALIARDVIGDFRDPDIARFGFNPLYNGSADIDRAIDQLGAVLDNAEWSSYTERNAVT